MSFGNCLINDEPCIGVKYKFAVILLNRAVTISVSIKATPKFPFPASFSIELDYNYFIHYFIIHSLHQKASQRRRACPFMQVCSMWKMHNLASYYNGAVWRVSNVVLDFSEHKLNAHKWHYLRDFWMIAHTAVEAVAILRVSWIWVKTSRMLNSGTMLVVMFLKNCTILLDWSQACSSHAWTSGEISCTQFVTLL